MCDWLWEKGVTSRIMLKACITTPIQNVQEPATLIGINSKMVHHINLLQIPLSSPQSQLSDDTNNYKNIF